MRTIIAGSRDIIEYDLFLKEIALVPWKISVVICGKARGVDSLGERWAKEKNIPIEYFPANWNKYGKVAGYIRNVEMAKNAEALFALWDGESKGTKSMIIIASNKDLKIHISTKNKE